MNRFRVRVSMDLAGVREERREKRRKRNIAKNERKRVRDLLYKALDRVGSDPIQRPTLWTM